MKKIKEYKGIIIIVLIIVLIGFYWFGIRPNQIRKKCYSEHLSTIPDLSFENFLKRIKSNSLEEIFPYGKNAYNNCLKENGLKE